MTARHGILLMTVIAALALVVPPIPSVAAFKYLETGMKVPEISGLGRSASTGEASNPVNSRGPQSAFRPLPLEVKG